jgi:hypothetical protein
MHRQPLRSRAIDVFVSLSHHLPHSSPVERAKGGGGRLPPTHWNGSVDPVAYVPHATPPAPAQYTRRQATLRARVPARTPHRPSLRLPPRHSH